MAENKDFFNESDGKKDSYTVKNSDEGKEQTSIRDDSSDKIVDELREAYAADKERRFARDDELKAAKDYLGVLLSEIESKNSEIEDQKNELENKKIEAVELAMKLKNAELGLDDPMPDESSKKGAGIWPGIAIVEMIVIVALIVTSLIVFWQLKDGNNQTGQENTAPLSTASPVIVETRPTQKYNDSLADSISNLEAFRYEKMRPSIKEIDGLEYLVFSDGTVSVAYKNEYYTDDKEFRKVVLVEKDGKRFMTLFGYDLKGDIGKMVPKMSKINNRDVVVISDYDDNSGKIPENLLVIDYDRLNWYDGNRMAENIKSLLKTEIAATGSGREDLPGVLTVTTAKAVYKFGLTEAFANEVIYNEYELADLNRDFKMTVDENGISWTTEVRLGDDIFLGKLAGDLSFGENVMAVTNAKFGAYALANCENPEFANVLTPSNSIPERYLTVSADDSRRLYITVNENVRMNEYDWSRLDTSDANNWKYLDEAGNEISVRGIDVSKYQGKIDWAKVAQSGIKFAIIRLGFRGMNEGTLEIDPYFKENIEGATKAGIQVGVYFFSQAVNVKEAIEEAEFVLEAIKPYNVTYPVIFDTEKVATLNARANGITYEQRTNNCIAFCERVMAMGYKPMIYAITKYMITGIDLEQLDNFDLWYAVYNKNITLPYRFEMLQYSESGSVPGVTGNVDLDISFVDYSLQSPGGK